MIMSMESKQILEMLSAGKITVDEAERLLSALNVTGPSEDEKSGRSKRLKFLRVKVEPKDPDQRGDRVNVRVPINLVRAGLKWAAFIPRHHQHKVDEALREKGIDMNFRNLKPEDLEELIENLNDLEVEVDGEEVVRVYCE
jgi:hypothetical protein